MRLLALARTGQLGRGQAIPKEVRPHLLDAALHIISATTLAPYVHWRPLTFPVVRVTEPSGVLLTEQIELSAHGVLDGKLEWLGRMREGFALVKGVAAWLCHEYSPEAARELYDLLTRLNLMLGVVETIRDGAQLEYSAGLLAKQVETCLTAFSEFGIFSPELLGWVVATHKKEEKGIPDEARAWEAVAEAAFEAWDRAEPYAACARQADTFTELLESTLACFPYYEGAVRLFYDAMSRYAQLTRKEPTELLRDFRVVEEYRVGALELLRYLGHHLVTRVGHFLFHSVGLPVPEAVRKALNAARAEISVYPDAVREIWLEAAQEVGPTRVLSEDTYWELLDHLENRVEQKMISFYSDSDVVRAAFRIHNDNWPPITFDLETGWQDRVFVASSCLLTPSEVKIKTKTVMHNKIPGDELVARLLGAVASGPPAV